MRETIHMDGIFDAAARGDASTVRALVKLGGANANATDALGRTPVWIAARGGHTETVRALVACGADVHTVDNRSCTPVWAAAQHGHTETVRVLVQDCLANVHTAGDDGRTPVYAAAANGHTETVWALVDCGADARTANSNGQTPVGTAAMYGHTKTVRALVDCGADARTANSNGWTPIFLAASYGHTETVRALVECGADVNTADNGGWTPIFLAASRGHTETVRALVRSGADPCPTLHTAAKHDCSDVIWMLVRECGVDPACLDRYGRRARDLAAPGSRAEALLRCLEAWEAPGHPVYTVENATKRVDGFECPVCLEDTTGDGIAFVPCGHRVCPGCWAGLCARGLRACPKCRGLIAHGEPQGSLPDEQKLYSRFCVEIGGPQKELTATGVHWQLNSTTTDGVFSMAKSVVLGGKIRLRVVKWDGDVLYEDLYKISKSKSIYEQIYAKLHTGDCWESVEVCSDDVVLCTVMKGSKSEFDAECNKVIANVEAERPGKSIFLGVKVRDLVELVDHAGELSMRDLQIRLRPEWDRLIFAHRRTTLSHARRRA
jgi:ankyrin repeat protein